MYLLAKTTQQIAEGQGFRYDQPDHVPIRQYLLRMQQGFCAYGEFRLEPARDSPELEHFNPQLKGTADDNSANWYFVLRKYNLAKGDRMPAVLVGMAWHFDLMPLKRRIGYDAEDHCYYAQDQNDEEARALIDHLGVNMFSLVEKRKGFLRELHFQLEHIYGTSLAGYQQFVGSDHEKCHFPTAVSLLFGFDWVALLTGLPKFDYTATFRARD